MIHFAGMSALPPLPQTPQLPKSERHDSRAAIDSTYYTVSDDTSGQTGDNDADNLNDMVGRRNKLCTYESGNFLEVYQSLLYTRSNFRRTQLNSKLGNST